MDSFDSRIGASALDKQPSAPEREEHQAASESGATPLTGAKPQGS